MYIYICVYVCVYIYVYIHEHTYTHTKIFLLRVYLKQSDGFFTQILARRSWLLHHKNTLVTQ